MTLVIAAPASAQPSPDTVVRVESLPTEPARIDLAASERPLAQVLEALARALGFAGVALDDPALGARPTRCAWAARSAWACLAELSEAERFAFTKDAAGRLRVLPVPAGVDLRRAYAVAGGVLLVVAQRAPGAVQSEDPREPAARGTLLVEPRLALTCTDLEVLAQTDVDGNPCELLGVRKVPVFLPALVPTSREGPWRGLSSVTVRVRVELARERLHVEFRALAEGGTARPVAHGFMSTSCGKQGSEVWPN